MKATIITITLVLVSFLTTISAQESGHLKFMGIEIEGDASEFERKLEAKGFEKTLSDAAGVTMLSGVFTNRDCSVRVVRNGKTNEVYTVVVVFEDDESLELHHDYLSGLFSKKYGEPTWSKKTCDDSGMGEIRDLNKKDCEYYDVWELSNGRILIYTSIMIMIFYEDKEGSSQLEDENLDDI